MPAKLKQRREQLGFSQQELAERLDISQQSIAAYEVDTRRPAKPILDALVRVLKVDGPEDLGFTIWYPPTVGWL